MQQNNDKKPGLSWSTPIESKPAAQQPKQPALQPTTSKALPAASATNNTVLARYIGIFAGGLVVGVLLAWGWSATTHGGTPFSTKTNNTIAATNTAVTSNTSKSTTSAAKAAAAVSLDSSGGVMTNSELSVASPQKAGQSVVIDSATASKPTWVVVYDSANGKAGNALGAQLFFTTGPGIVTLLRPTTAGHTYFVGRSIDNGDHKFSKSTDKAVLDANGNPEMVSFTAN